MSKSTKKKPTKPRSPRQGQNAGITVEMYDAIYREFLVDQSPTGIAKRLGLDPRTVRKYLDRGDLVRGLRPIRERFAEVLEKAHRQEDIDAARALAENLNLVRECKTVLAARFREQLAADGVSLTARASEELPADVTGSLEKIIRLEMSLLGEPDLKVETTSRFEGWARDEMIEYAETGKLPRHLVGKATSR